MPSAWVLSLAHANAAPLEFTAGMDLDTFRQDPRTIAAVERKLPVISEAAVRLGKELTSHIRTSRCIGSTSARS